MLLILICSVSAAFAGVVTTTGWRTLVNQTEYEAPYSMPAMATADSVLPLKPTVIIVDDFEVPPNVTTMHLIADLVLLREVPRRASLQTAPRRYHFFLWQRTAPRTTWTAAIGVLLETWVITLPLQTNGANLSTNSNYTIETHRFDLHARAMIPSGHYHFGFYADVDVHLDASDGTQNSVRWLLHRYPSNSSGSNFSFIDLHGNFVRNLTGPNLTHFKVAPTNVGRYLPFQSDGNNETITFAPVQMAFAIFAECTMSTSLVRNTTFLETLPLPWPPLPPPPSPPPSPPPTPPPPPSPSSSRLIGSPSSTVISPSSSTLSNPPSTPRSSTSSGLLPLSSPPSTSAPVATTMTQTPVAVTNTSQTSAPNAPVPGPSIEVNAVLIVASVSTSLLVFVLIAIGFFSIRNWLRRSNKPIVAVHYVEDSAANKSVELDVQEHDSEEDEDDDSSGEAEKPDAPLLETKATRVYRDQPTSARKPKAVPAKLEGVDEEEEEVLELDSANYQDDEEAAPLTPGTPVPMQEVSLLSKTDSARRRKQRVVSGKASANDLLARPKKGGEASKQ